MVNSLTDETATKVTVSFLHFEKVEIMTKRGVSKKLKPVKSDATIFYIINFIENFLIKFVHHRNMLKHFRSSVKDFYNFFDSVNIDMDFSENIMQEHKIYHAYLSDNLKHDQAFVKVVMDYMLIDINLEMK